MFQDAWIVVLCNMGLAFVLSSPGVTLAMGSVFPILLK